MPTPVSTFPVSLPADADVRLIIESIGGNPDNNRYDSDQQLWYLEASSQEDIDFAVAATATTREVNKLSALKASKLADLAAMRFSKETGGVTLGGALIRTDRESQSLIAGAYSAAKDGVISSFDFKAASGWVTITDVAMQSIGVAVATHVQACFSRERALSDQIEAAVDEAALEAIDITVGWP